MRRSPNQLHYPPQSIPPFFFTQYHLRYFFLRGGLHNIKLLIKYKLFFFFPSFFCHLFNCFQQQFPTLDVYSTKT